MVRTLLFGATLLALSAGVVVGRSSSPRPAETPDQNALPARFADSTQITLARALDPSVPLPEPPDTAKPEEPVVERKLGTGRASYYGRALAGNPTASGETFDPAKLTAAHPKLPFGTRVRVTNLRNERSVIVRINDRGPYSGNRVIDISRRAAQQLKMLGRGLARVRIEVLEKK